MEGSEKKIIITVAVTGSRPTKDMNPSVPYSPEEIVQASLNPIRQALPPSIST